MAIGGELRGPVRHGVRRLRREQAERGDAARAEQRAGRRARAGTGHPSLERPDRIKPTQRSIDFRPDLTMDLEPYSVAVVEISAR